MKISIKDAIAQQCAARRIVIAVGAGYVCIGDVKTLSDGSLLLVPCLPLTYKEVPLHVWEPSEENKI